MVHLKHRFSAPAFKSVKEKTQEQNSLENSWPHFDISHQIKIMQDDDQDDELQLTLTFKRDKPLTVC